MERCLRLYRHRRDSLIRPTILLLAAYPLLAHDVITTKITWSREVSRIVYKRCASCHHDGGAAFSLIDYAEARPWAKAIKDEVLTRRMPPWNAVKGFGEFKDDPGLTQEELEIIGDWVEGGAPEGNPSYLPAKSRQHTAPEPIRARTLAISGTLVATRAIDAVGVQSVGGALQMIAGLADGRILPLLGVQLFHNGYSGPYYC